MINLPHLTFLVYGIRLPQQFNCSLWQKNLVKRNGANRPMMFKTKKAEQVVQGGVSSVSAENNAPTKNHVVRSNQFHSAQPQNPAILRWFGPDQKTAQRTDQPQFNSDYWLTHLQQQNLRIDTLTRKIAKSKI